MWGLWLHIAFLCSISQILSTEKVESNENLTVLHTNQDFYVEVAMVPFTKNRRFFVHEFDTLKHERPEWIGARITIDDKGQYYLGMHQVEMKNAMKQNANFNLSRLFVDRKFDFPMAQTSDSSTVEPLLLNLLTQRATRITADSIFYKLIPEQQ